MINSVYIQVKLMSNKMKLYFRIIVLTITVLLTSCDDSTEHIDLQAADLHDAMQHLTDVIVHDIFSPPVASRIYAYPSIAAYEILASQDSTYLTLAGQLHELESIPVSTESINHDVAAIQAFFTVGKALIFSEEKVDEYIQKWHEELLSKGISQNQLDRSIEYAQMVSDHIMDCFL